MRPTTFKVGNTIYWSIRTYTDAGVLVDADSTPSVAVRKNGVSVADAVTVTKRAATTGIYDCSYNPAGEAYGDSFELTETATISSQAYENAWVIAAEEIPTTDQIADAVWNELTAGHTSIGTFGFVATETFNQVNDLPDAVWDEAQSGHTSAGTFGAYLDAAVSSISGGGGGDATAANQTSILNAISNLNDFDPAVDEVITDTASRNASKADVSALATQLSVDSIDTDIQNIGSDVSTILADTNELQTNQGNWLTATGFATPSDCSTDAEIYTYFTSLSREDAFKATGFNTVAPDNASITAILADTNELQQNQGNWVTATGFATPADCSTDAEIYTYFTSLSREDVFKATGFNTVVPDNTTINDIHNALPDNLSFMDITVDGEVASQLTPEQIYLYMVGGGRSDNFKADVSGLSTFDASTDQVVASNMRGTDNALLASAAPANWSTLIVGTGVDAGKVTTSNPASGGGSNHTAQDVANLILVTPANKLATDASGNVEANNMRGTDGANTVAPVDVSADVAAILADTNELQANQGDWLTADVSGLSTQASVNTLQTTADAILNDTDDLQTHQGDWLTADVSGLATQASIDALNDFDPATDTVANVTLVDTTTNLTNGGGGGGGASAADIYAYFTDGTREDAFKADTSGLSTFDPANDVVARVTLVDTTTDLTNQTAGGVGMFQASVRIEDINGAALQGARVNVDGTTLSLTTGVSGLVTFNLDSGVYLLNVLPPAGYDTPSGQVLTITASDPSTTVFSLVETSPPDGCDVAWL